MHNYMVNELTVCLLAVQLSYSFFALIVFFVKAYYNNYKWPWMGMIIMSLCDKIKKMSNWLVHGRARIEFCDR